MDLKKIKELSSEAVPCWYQLRNKFANEYNIIL